MELKDILLLIDPAAPNAAPLALAAGLARTHGAAVRGLCLYQTPPPSPAECYALGDAAVAAVLRQEAAEVSQLLAPAHHAFMTALGRGGLPPVWEQHADLWVEEALARAATADLAIVGRLAADSDRWREVLENLALRGGAPVLVVPEGRAAPASFSRAVVAWNGSREAKRALDDALLFLEGCGRTDLVVVEDHRGAPEGDLPALIGHLQRHGVAANAVRLPAHDKSVAEVLRRHCEQAGADLLVLGAYSHSKMGERFFGGVTQSLLRDPPVATLVSH